MLDHDPAGVSASWNISPESGVLASCELGNITLTLNPSGLVVNSPFENGFSFRSNSVEEPVLALNTSVTVKASPSAEKSRIYRNRTSPLMYEGTALNLSGTAGRSFSAYIQARTRACVCLLIGSSSLIHQHPSRLPASHSNSSHEMWTICG